MNASDLDELNKRLHVRELGIGARMLRSPRIIYSKGLQSITRWLGTSRHARATLFWGDEMNVVLPDEVSFFIHKYGFFEPELSKLFLMYMRPGMTFFDVGAHFGYFSLLASHLVGPTGAVHAFEPTPSTFKILSENLGNKPNVVLKNVAAFSHAGTLRLKDFGIRLAAYNSVSRGEINAPHQKGATAAEYDVAATTIDDYVQESGASPNFVKIDAEGAELEILQGMSKTLAAAQPLLSLEVGDHDADAQSRPKIDYLLQHDYQAFEYGTGGLKPHAPKERYEYDNLLFVPRSAAADFLQGNTQ